MFFVVFDTNSYRDNILYSFIVQLYGGVSMFGPQEGATMRCDEKSSRFTFREVFWLEALCDPEYNIFALVAPASDGRVIITTDRPLLSEVARMMPKDTGDNKVVACSSERMIVDLQKLECTITPRSDRIRKVKLLTSAELKELVAKKKNPFVWSSKEKSADLQIVFKL